MVTNYEITKLTLKFKWNIFLTNCYTWPDLWYAILYDWYSGVSFLFQMMNIFSHRNCNVVQFICSTSFIVHCSLFVCIADYVGNCLFVNWPLWVITIQSVVTFPIHSALIFFYRFSEIHLSNVSYRPISVDVCWLFALLLKYWAHLFN